VAGACDAIATLAIQVNQNLKEALKKVRAYVLRKQKTFTFFVEDAECKRAHYFIGSMFGQDTDALLDTLGIIVNDYSRLHPGPLSIAEIAQCIVLFAVTPVCAITDLPPLLGMSTAVWTATDWRRMKAQITALTGSLIFIPNASNVAAMINQGLSKAWW